MTINASRGCFEPIHSHTTSHYYKHCYCCGIVCHRLANVCECVSVRNAWEAHALLATIFVYAHAYICKRTKRSQCAHTHIFKIQFLNLISFFFSIPFRSFVCSFAQFYFTFQLPCYVYVSIVCMWNVCCCNALVLVNSVVFHVYIINYLCVDILFSTRKTRETIIHRKHHYMYVGDDG